MTAVVAMISFGYKGVLQQRSFTDKKQATQSIDHHQTRTIEIDTSVDQAFELALDALKTLDKQAVPVPDDVLVKLENLLPRRQYLTIRKTDQDAGMIEAGLKARVMGIPELLDFSRISIRIEEVNSTVSRVCIESRANTIFDTYDMGKNLHYVNTIALDLRKVSQQLDAVSRLEDIVEEKEGNALNSNVLSDTTSKEN